MGDERFGTGLPCMKTPSYPCAAVLPQNDSFKQNLLFLSYCVLAYKNACFLICPPQPLCFAGPVFHAYLLFAYISVSASVCLLSCSDLVFCLHVLPCLFCLVCALAALQVVSVSACYWSNSKLVLVMQFDVPTLLCTHALSFDLPVAS